MKRDANPEKGLEALDQCEYMVLAMTDGEESPTASPSTGYGWGRRSISTAQRQGRRWTVCGPIRRSA